MTHLSVSFSEHSSLISWTSDEFWKWSPFYSLAFDTNWILIWVFVPEMNVKCLYELCSIAGLSFCLCHLLEDLWSDWSSPLHDEQKEGVRRSHLLYWLLINSQRSISSMNTLEYHPDVKYNNIRVVWPLSGSLWVHFVVIRRTIISNTFICLFTRILWILRMSGQALRSYFGKSGSEALTPWDLTYRPGTLNSF